MLEPDVTAVCRISAPVPPLTSREAGSLAEVFKALGDPVRLELISMIAAYGEPCVCDLTKAFDLAAPTISHHLKVLRKAGLIESRRQGTWIHYRAVPEKLAELSILLDGQARTAVLLPG
ncbi:Arsenical resistance operon repressor [[Actinomadura] parvosata subsp. kistnae]|uniref:ArsR/SmtB family transcription factor n=1 Tax=[Actinomadura] parvosata TaxID=1955412 RepID=UPI0009ADCE9B|nr:Arsenical resistance operon repressor [Actinomadura parvosata subsp. kistnae]